MKDLYFDATVNYILQEDKDYSKISFQIKEYYTQRAYWNMVKQARENGVDSFRLRITAKKETWNDKASRFFHAMRDALAAFHGEDKRQMKINLKLAYGVKEEVDTGTWILKSVAEYTQTEWLPLIEGAKIECWEQGIDIQREVEEWQAVTV